MSPVRIDDPADLAAVFEADRETHVYGLADLEEPFWSNSAWYRDGDAVVGLVSDGGDWETGYAMSQMAPGETLELLCRLGPKLRPGTWITGPLGMHERFSQIRAARPVGDHWRMILDDLVGVPGSEDVVAIGPESLDALVDLYDSDPGKAFFMPSMLERSPFVGVWDDGALVAAAGTHVASARHGVAAVGAVITRPSHRGRGLGKMVVAALCQRLAEDHDTIGLNVETANVAALRVYDSLGFRRAFQYEEVEVL